jgi:serine/threonine-protein kinase
MLSEIAACIGALLADSLAAAHAAGVIHRDVKPANVLIAPGGRLLLADFGVARLETDDSLVTRSGALLGTPAYMSPEQATGETATARSDLYSLGATLYHLATGGLPFTGSPAKVMSMITTGGLVAPVRRRPSCGVDLSRLIERLMAPDPATRPASATEIAAELRALAIAGGLGDATVELAAYFEDPAGFLRSRIPAVVSALVTAAQTAVGQARLPRAMALADRASALAPGDRIVTALVEQVTDGGRAQQRRRWLAIGGAGAVLAMAAIAVATRLPDGSPRSPVAPVPAVPVENVVVAVDAPPPVAPVRMPPPDAAAPPRRRERVSPGLVPRPAVRAAPSAPPPEPLPVAAPPLDAGIDAADPSPPVRPAGHVIVHNDVWCTIRIDGVDRGNHRNEPLEVAAGHHTVRCVNPAGEWTREVDVAPGAIETLSGTVLREIEVAIDIDATLNGRPYPRGSVARLRAGIFEVVAGDKKQFITIRASCTLRSAPELGCYLPR